MEETDNMNQMIHSMMSLIIGRGIIIMGETTTGTTGTITTTTEAMDTPKSGTKIEQYSYVSYIYLPGYIVL